MQHGEIGTGTGMKRFSRRLFFGGMLGAGLGVLAACGGGTSTTVAPTKAAVGGGVTPGSAPTAAIAPATVPPNAKIVTFWIPWGQPERQKWVDEWGAKFHEKYPDQALKMEFVGFANMRQRWIAAQQAGQMPELLCASFTEMGAASVAGATERADDVVKDLGGNQFFLEAPLATWQYQGAYYGIPLYVFPRMMYYRKDLFAAKGLKPPTDWESWYAGAKALTGDDRFGSALAPADHSPEVIDYLMRGQGSSIFDKAGKVLLDTPEGEAAVDMFARLIKDTGPQGMPNYTEDDQVKFFLAKDVGTIVTWPSILQWTAQQAPQRVKDLGTLVPPGKSQAPQPVTTNIGFALGKSAKNLEGAKKYLSFIMQDEPNRAFLHSIVGVFPATRSLANSPKFLDNPILSQYPEVVKTSLEASNNGVEGGYANGFNPTNTLALNTNPGFPQMMQAIGLENVPVKQAIADQVKRMNAAISQGRR